METANSSCSFQTITNSQQFNPQAEDILTDEDLLELFRIIKHIIKKKPDTERIAKLYFCIAYAMGDMYQFYKPKHSDHLIFKDDSLIADVLLPATASCCQQEKLSVSYLTNPSPANILPPIDHDKYSVRPYTNIKSIYSQPSSSPSTPSSSSSLSLPLLEDQSRTPSALNRYPHINTLIHDGTTEILMEPKQRGFYYQENRLSREPPLLQRYAEQGVLTQDSLLKKRTKKPGELEFPFELPTPTKKPKIPHRHGEFNQRRDDIISRMRTVLMADLEQKAQRLPSNFSLTIEKATLPPIPNDLTTEEAGRLLAPALRILTFHSNMKPHLDNGMNQNGIYYNNDYFRLYLAFVQFQHIFRELFPNEVISYAAPIHLDEINTMPSPSSMIERDKDRERNANMKAYRPWIEPHLTETNWAAFRRNIMVGERIMQLTQVVGQGVLLMTKELSGSKLHLTFTNNEWDEFIQGLSQGLWDETIDWSHDDDEILAEYRKNNRDGSLLVNELRLKFATHFWFTDDGQVVPPAERKQARMKERLSLMNKQST